MAALVMAVDGSLDQSQFNSSNSVIKTAVVVSGRTSSVGFATIFVDRIGYFDMLAVGIEGCMTVQRRGEPSQG